jgi:cell division protein FtsL
VKGSRRPVPPVLRALGLLVLLLGALSLVVWRQTRGAALQREIRGLEAERAIAESERLRTATRIQGLQSRARILRVARDRLGMHLPADSQVVLVPLAAEEGSR